MRMLIHIHRAAESDGNPCTWICLFIGSFTSGFDRCSSDIQLKNTGNLYFLPFGHMKHSKADAFKIQVTCIF